jgi:hypothetical protein
MENQTTPVEATSPMLKAEDTPISTPEVVASIEPTLVKEDVAIKVSFEPITETTQSTETAPSTEVEEEVKAVISDIPMEVESSKATSPSEVKVEEVAQSMESTQTTEVKTVITDLPMETTQTIETLSSTEVKEEVITSDIPMEITQTTEAAASTEVKAEIIISEATSSSIDEVKVSDQEKEVLLRKQIHFYFSDANLSRDKFVLKELDMNRGFFKIAILLNFNKFVSP